MKGPNSSEPGRLFLPFQFGKSFGDPVTIPFPAVAVATVRVTIALTPVGIAITFDPSSRSGLLSRFIDRIAAAVCLDIVQSRARAALHKAAKALAGR
jgi:hypothetical protein